MLVAEEDVLGDRQHRHQRKLLVDDDDALAFAVVDAFEVAFLAAIDDLAVIGAGRIDARQHLHQRRLAGAVLADHGVDFALLDAEVDVRQRLDAGKRLGDAAHLQNRRSHCGHCSSRDPDKTISGPPINEKGPAQTRGPRFLYRRLTSALRP